MISKSVNPIKLELAWEAVQDVYATHANIQAYRYRLRTFCSFGEKTYLMKVVERSIQAFYDPDESRVMAQLGLQDFLKSRWRTAFQKKALDALREARRYSGRYHLNSRDLSKQELFRRVREGTKINNKLFACFCACQPQYTSLVEEYVKGYMGSALSEEDRSTVFLALTRSTRKTPLMEEEIRWKKVYAELSKRFDGHYPSLNEYSYPELETHARLYGLIVAADGMPPWTKESLYEKLLTSHSDPVHTKVDLQSSKGYKRAIVRQYHVSQKVVDLCDAIVTLGHLRLRLRVLGWMPVMNIITSELFPQLPNYLPYTARQLECTVPEELEKIFKGNHSLSAQELEERQKLLFYGLYRGKEVRWSGNDAKKMLSELIPVFNTSIHILKGQIGWKGKVRARCYVIHWDAKNVTDEIRRMPLGAVLIAGQTRPQLMPAIQKAAAIVTDEGGLLSHAAIVSRELGKPCVIGTKYATKVFSTGDLLDVDADIGIVKLIERHK